MKQGDIILAPVTQSDDLIKNRPAVLLRKMRPFGDWLVCGVSTQLHQEVIGFDEIISPLDADYNESGLIKPSLIRLGFLMILPEKNAAGVIGSISNERHRRLLISLSGYLLNSEKT